MKVIKKTLSLPENEYYKIHLELVNTCLPVRMSKRELEVISVFMRINSLIRFESKGKKIVKKELNLSDGSLGNHLRSLRDKGFILNVEGEEIILPILFPEGNEQVYNFIIKNNDI